MAPTQPTPPPQQIPTPQQIMDVIKSYLPTSSLTIMTDIGAVATAVSKLCDLAMTPQGQLLLEHWRTDTVKVESWIAKGASAISTFIKGLVK